MGLVTTSAPRARLRVDVAPGRVPSERWVTFTVSGHVHSLAVDRADVDGDALKVVVIDDHGDDVVIELPRPAVAGQRIAVPRGSVFVDEPPSGWSAWVLLGLVVVVLGLGGWALLQALE